MAPIRPLDPALVNKIAAGEVIERPASVVKELVENALDAGATRIEITLEEGGAGLIRVSDDGSGIPKAELPLAVAPHATNKIAAVDDLFNIRTLGFRGEALASIASVSQFRMVSRTTDQLEAYELGTLDSKIDSPRPCAAPVGTTVEVRNLFFNVPARRKFLRHASTEVAHATEQVARVALAHPGVTFRLSHNGRELRNLPGDAQQARGCLAARRTRIGDFYGAELAACLLPIERTERGLSIEALIAPPAESRPSSKWQYLFLNGRFISDRRIAFAIREAFRGLVEHDRYPVVFLFLTTSPSQFDVNVHPTKIEVRWADAGLIQSQVLAALRETLLGHDLTPRLAAFESRQFAGGTSLPDLGHPARSQAVGDPTHYERTRQALADYLKSIDPTQARLHFAPPRFATDALRPSILTTLEPPHTHAPLPNDRSEGHAPPRSISSPSDAPLPTPESQVPDSLSVVQIHNTYLVAETDQGMVIIDQHALHERILYERFRERILTGPLESQRLLVPAVFEASPAQSQAATDHGSVLGRLGIEVSSFGNGALAVQSFPTLLPNLDAAQFVSDLLDKIGDAPSARDPQLDDSLIHQCLDMMACKAAVKAGDALTNDEMQALLAQRHLTLRSSNCPHGRPTTLELTTRDLEKQFKRI